MTFRVRIILLFVGALTLLGLSSEAIAKTPAVVLIEYRSSFEAGRCLGFFLAEDLILTAGHCVPWHDGETVEFHIFLAENTGEFRKIAFALFSMLERSDEFDYALFKVNEVLSSYYYIFSPFMETPIGAEELWTFSYDSNSRRLSTMICPFSPADRNAGDIVHTCVTRPGDSGSPVYAPGLGLIGLHYGRSRRTGSNRAIEIRQVIAESSYLRQRFGIPEGCRYIVRLERYLCD